MMHLFELYNIDLNFFLYICRSHKSKCIHQKLEYEISRITQANYQAALEAIYQATNGDEWLDNENWMNGFDPCDRDFLWYGLSCNFLETPSKIVYISLDYNNLSGTIPGEVGLLTELRGFEVGRNNLSGTIPSEIGFLSELEVLTMHDNSLGGAIPSELGMLENVWYVRLNDNSFSSTLPDLLGDLSSLFYLFLHENEITGTIVCDNVPSQVMRISADCAGNFPEVICDCCNGCSRPSSAPTDAPSTSPITATPTKAPTTSVPTLGSPNYPPQSPTSSPNAGPSANAPSIPSISNTSSPTVVNGSASPKLSAIPSVINGEPVDGNDSPSLAPSAFAYSLVPVMYTKRSDDDVEASLASDDDLLLDYFSQDLQASCPPTLSFCNSASAASRLLRSRSSLQVVDVSSRIDNSKQCVATSTDDRDCAYVITEVGVSYDSSVYPSGIIKLIAAGYTERFMRESSIPFDNLTPPIIEAEAALTKFTFLGKPLEGTMNQRELDQFMRTTFGFLRALFLHSHEPHILLGEVDFYTQDFDESGNDFPEFAVGIVMSGRYIPPPVLDFSESIMALFDDEEVEESYLSALEESNNSYFENVDNFDDLELDVVAEGTSTDSEVSNYETGVVTTDDFGGYRVLVLSVLVALLLFVLLVLCFMLWRRRNREEEEGEEKLRDEVESVKQMQESCEKNDEQDIFVSEKTEDELGPLRASGITEDVFDKHRADMFPDDVSELTNLHDHEINPAKSRSTKTPDAPHTVEKSDPVLLVDFPSRIRK